MASTAAASAQYTLIVALPLDIVSVVSQLHNMRRTDITPGYHRTTRLGMSSTACYAAAIAAFKLGTETGGQVAVLDVGDYRHADAQRVVTICRCLCMAIPYDHAHARVRAHVQACCAGTFARSRISDRTMNNGMTVHKQ